LLHYPRDNRPYSLLRFLLRLQKYYKYLTYTRIFTKKCTFPCIFAKKVVILQRIS
jgi:hypothetical protein